MNSKNVKMISSRAEIKKIFKNGAHFSGKYLKFIYIKNIKTIRCSKLLIWIPKKNIKLAVNRNKIKRQLKSFYFKNNKKNNFNGEVIIIYNYLKPVKYIKLEKDMLCFKTSCF